MLRHVIFLTGQEEAAIDADDFDEADRLAELRGLFLVEVWSRKDEVPSSLLLALYEELEKAQTRLEGKATALRDEAAKENGNIRKQSKYYAADRHVQAQADRGYFVTKRS